MIIIGITGTIGAGKGTIVEYLKKKGFTHFSAREFLLKELDKRELVHTRDNIFLVANELRRDHFPGYIISELMKEAEKNGEFAVIESIRSVGEIEVLRKSNAAFYLFAVDADQKLRYERIKERKLSTDFVTFEKFVEDENKEMASNEPWSQNLKACIDEADIVFENNGSIDELEAKIDAELGRILSHKEPLAELSL